MIAAVCALVAAAGAVLSVWALVLAERVYARADALLDEAEAALTAMRELLEATV